MLAKVAGSNQFKVGTGDKSWSELPWSPAVSGNNGLIYKDGELVVDFSQMPTDKFEKLLHSLKLPVWLEQDTDFYVDGSTGSDILSDGRGLSIDKAFKTIQTCINYVCDYFTFQNNVVRILVDYKSVYTERITLKNFQGENWFYFFASDNGTIVYNQRVKVVWNKLSNASNEATTLYIQGNNKYSIYCFEFEFDVTEAPKRSNYSTCSVVISSNCSATVYFSSCKFCYNVVNYSTVNLGSYPIACYFFNIQGAINIQFYAYRYLPSEIECINFENLTKGSLYIFSLMNNATVILGTSYSSYNYVNDFLIKMKKMSTFVYSNTGSLFMYKQGSSSGISYLTFKFPEGYSNPTGKRYECLSGGKIDVYGTGTSALPGTTAGTVETSTYSWYK